MRIVRTFRLALAAAAILPALAGAQSTSQPPRVFADSWFWGAKGGSTMFTTGAQGTSKVSAPTIGAEWLITRTHTALYVSVEQAFFSNTAGVFDASAPGSVRSVDISDLRRYNAGVFFFPKQYGSVRPYAGLGLAINVIQNADPQGTYSSEDSQQLVFEAVDEQSSRVAAVFTLGAQAQVQQRLSVFAQAATMPTRRNFLINGASNTFVIEAGVRFNLIGAVESLK
jgi:outer membrane protein W